MPSPSRDFDPGAAAAPGSGVFGLPHRQDEARVVLVPVPFDATTSYGKGAARAPSAILRASRQVDLFDLDTGRPYEAGITMLDESDEVHAWNLEAGLAAAPVIAAGGAHDARDELRAALTTVNAVTREVHAWVERTVAELLAGGKVVGTVGGDHSVALGAIAAHAAKHPGMGILHVDAHADLRPAYEGFTDSHASIMHNVLSRLPAVEKLVQVGVRDLSEEELDAIVGSNGRVEAYFDRDLARRSGRGEPFEKVAASVVASLPRDVYVSFDIDGLDPSLCPHTGTPVPGGLSFQQAVTLLAAVPASGRRLIGFDLTEVCPGPHDEWDANVGARVLYKLIGFSLLGGDGGAP